MPIDPNVIISGIAVVFGSGGAAWVGVRTSLNGTRERVTRIENKLDKSLEIQSRHGERLATLEAKE